MRGTSASKESLLALGLAAAALLIFFPGVIAGESFFYSDFHFVIQPLRAQLGEALREGSVLWAPALNHGQPLLASPFAAALYPPNWLFRYSSPASGRLLTLLTVGHIFWGAAGTWLLLRRRGRSLPARFLGSLCFGFCGMALSGSYLSLLSMTVSWSPWAILALEMPRTGPGHRRILQGAVVLGLILGLQILCGDPFMVAGTLLGVALHAALGASIGRDGGSKDLRPLAVAGGGLGLALVLGAPLLVAAMRLASVSARSGGLGDSVVFEWSLHPVAALNLVLPGIFGDSFRLGPGEFVAPGLHDGRLPLFPSLYFGLLAFSLACLGAARGQRRSRLESLWLLLLFALALGRYLPLHGLLLDLPGFSSTRYPVKWLLAGMLPLSLLAAEGLDTLGSLAGKDQSRRLLAFFSSVFCLPLFVGGVFGLGPGAGVFAAAFVPSPGAGGESEALARTIRELFLGGALRAALPVAGAVLASCLALRKKRSELVPAICAAFCAVDLASSNATLAPAVGDEFYRVPPAAVDALKKSKEPVSRVWIDNSAQALGVRTIVPKAVDHVSGVARAQRERLDAYIGAPYGILLAFTSDTEALAPRSYLAYRSAVERAPARERALLLGMANVSHAVSILDRAGPGLSEISRWGGLAEKPLRLFAVDRPLPRLRVVEALRVHSGLADLVEILARSPDEFSRRFAFIDRSAVGREGDWVHPPRGVSGGSATGLPRLAVITDRPERLEVEVSGPASFLVIADTLTPGWSAEVDGKTAPLLPVNLAFRGVPIPEGSHRAVVAYEPFAWR